MAHILVEKQNVVIIYNGVGLDVEIGGMFCYVNIWRQIQGLKYRIFFWKALM